MTEQNKKREGDRHAKRWRKLWQQNEKTCQEKENDEGQERQEVVCTVEMYSQMQPGIQTMPDMSAGSRLAKATRQAQSTFGGGTYQGRTIMQGVPRNTDAQAIRSTTMLGV